MNPGAANRRLLALCADDFGQSAAISEGIARLATQSRLSALSCLTTSAPWRALAALLRDLPESVERGLHFNLTEGAPVSAALRRAWPRLPPLPRLMLAAWSGQLPLAAIAAEWQAQWDAFVDATGRLPAFVDGHEHVHQLRGVRDIVLAGVCASAAPIAVRNTGTLRGPGAALKRAAIRHSGGAALEAALRARGVPHNAVLLGAYDFGDRDYRQLMRAWLANLPAEGSLLFCHPGSAAARDAADDRIASARQREAAYLGSAAFLADLDEFGVRLGRVWQRRGA